VSVSILVAFVTVFDMIFICDIQWSVFVHVCPYLSMNIIGFAIAHRRAIVICLCIGVVAAHRSCILLILYTGFCVVYSLIYPCFIQRSVKYVYTVLYTPRYVPVYHIYVYLSLKLLNVLSAPLPPTSHPNAQKHSTFFLIHIYIAYIKL
jgi:hypothetical protein